MWVHGYSCSSASAVMESVLTFLLFGMPFVVFPFIPSPFEGAKVVMAMGVIAVLSAWTVYRHIDFHAVWKKNRDTCIVMASFLVLVLFHFFFSFSGTLLFRNAIRGQGSILLLHLLLFCFFIAPSYDMAISW